MVVFCEAMRFREDPLLASKAFAAVRSYATRFLVQLPSISIAVGGLTVTSFKLPLTLMVIGKFMPYQSQLVVMLSALSVRVRILMAHFMQQA
jgi:hypothetical protein